jgi:putative addiction module CopG family antidote
MAFDKLGGIIRRQLVMTLHLSESREQFVRSLVRDGRYGSEAEVIDEALRLLEQRDLEANAENRRVEALLIEGLDSGPSSPMTSGDWDEIEREGQRIIEARKARNGR